MAFRHYTRMEAERLGIKGTVRNLPDGSVEVFASADPSTLEKFGVFLRNSPGHSQVERVEISENETEREFADFRIIH